MAFCSKCGAQLNDNARFCPACGATTGAQQPQQPPVNQNNTQYTGNNNTSYQNYTSYSSSSSSDDTIMGILAYLSVLVFIPIFAAKESKFARYHSNQGVTLFIFELAWFVISAILTVIFVFVPALGVILKILKWAFRLGFLALIIIGIINVCNREMKPLPVIGDMLHIIK